MALALLALALAGCTSAPGPARDGAQAVAWSFTDTGGAVHSNATAAGNATMLFFMAGWCSSCRAMTSRLAAVHADYAPRGLRLYSVTFDTTDDDADLEAWKQRYAQPWPHGRDPGFAMQRAFEVVSQSTVVLLDPQGLVVRKWGYPGASEAALREAVEPLLAA